MDRLLKLKDSLKARYLCLQILIGVFKKKKTVSQTLEEQYLCMHSYEESDIARAKRISDFIFVYLQGLDECINVYSEKKLKLEVRNILRIVVAESLIDEAPDHAIVNSAVQLSKLSKSTKYFSGLVNAISRKILVYVQGDNLKLVSVLDEKLRSYLSNYYPDEVIKRIEKLMTKKAPLDINIKNFEEINCWKKKLNAKKLPGGILRLKNPKGLSSLPGFKDGKWWIQGASSAIPIKVLGKISGAEVLDLFSAPGGKAMQLISAGARVTCLDFSKKRLELLKKNLFRMNMKAKIINSDIRKFESKKKYDIITIDAPCSSSGTIIKNKDLPHLLPIERILNLTAIQDESLDLARKYVKEDGVILYCTCSLFPAEGEERVSEFLVKNQDWMQKAICPKEHGIEADWVDSKGGLRLRPDHLFDLGGMDGFYAAILVKNN